MSVCPKCGRDRKVWPEAGTCRECFMASLAWERAVRITDLERENRALWNILRRSGNPDRPGSGDMGHTDDEIRARLELELQDAAQIASAKA